MNATTWRWLCKPPLRALVIIFSATGRRALALASVVTIASAAMSDATRLPNIAFWWAALPPKRRALRGRAGMAAASVLDAQRQAALVQLGDHLVERLLAEVRDGQQIVLGLLDQLADRVDLRPLEAVAGTLRQLELLDGDVEVSTHRALGLVGELEAHCPLAHLLHQLHEGAQRGPGRGQRVTGADGAV